MRWIHLIVWACTAVVLACLIATVLYVNREATIRRDASVASCERGNTLRQTVNVIIVQLDLNDLAPLPLVDCSRIR